MDVSHDHIAVHGNLLQFKETVHEETEAHHKGHTAYCPKPNQYVLCLTTNACMPASAACPALLHTARRRLHARKRNASILEGSHTLSAKDTSKTQNGWFS